MIGVIANSADLATAAEFFQLFKTPWEPAVQSRRYRVLLATEDCADRRDDDLVLVYRGTEDTADRTAGVRVLSKSGVSEVSWGGSTLPIYGNVAMFDQEGATLRSAHGGVDYRRQIGTRRLRRIGYDLFAEVRHLLQVGQPVEQAATATLELHIALLRHLLVEERVPFLEVPPRPYGYDFTCCLTHDIDFCGVRRHGFDRTLAGFVGRASVGTLIDALRGRRPPSDVVKNWQAVASLPAVFLGLARDFWSPFDDYEQAEGKLPSTFFVVPLKGTPGVAPDGGVNPTRSVAYQASDVADQLQRTEARGCEVAVHGIDAWRDVAAGREEQRQVASVLGAQSLGVRMHWLYFDDRAPERIEDAGFAYDSTCGYNETVGFRAGTSQVFHLAGTRALMELPLTIMDSALLYRGRSNLDRTEALGLCRQVVANVRRFGGTLVVNWHDRSLAPERLWGPLYFELLRILTVENQVWFTTARQAVEWFKWRRSIEFRAVGADKVIVAAGRTGSGLPPARLVRRSAADTRVEELRFDGSHEVALSF